MKTVLFLCTYNAARSQMAEGLMNRFMAEGYKAYSAGTRPSRVDPYAIEVMAELGIDISDNRSKNVSEFRDMEFDYVVTLCDSAADSCPFFPGGEYLHKSFPDPSGREGFRHVRDQIRNWLIEVF